MPSSSQLSIFPSPSKSKDPSLPQPQLRDVSRNSRELKGLALHLVAPPPMPPKIQQANERVQHPAYAQRKDFTIPLKGQHSRRRSSTSNLKTIVEPTDQQAFTLGGPHRIKPALRSALKTCTPLSTSSASVHSKRTSASTTITPASSASIMTPATNHTTHSFDRKHNTTATIPATPGSSCIASPFDIRRDGAASAPPEKTDRSFPPRSHSLRCARTIASHNIEHGAPDYDCTSNRSMFPQYDSGKPLSQQKYYPAGATALPALPAPPKPALKVPTESPPTKVLERKDSGVHVPYTYECIPEPDYEDLGAIWQASTRLGACGGRKVQLSFYQTPGLESTFSIAQGSRKLFYARVNKSDEDHPTQLSVIKSSPTTEETQVLSIISLPSTTTPSATQPTCITPLFPHQAAIDALTAASNSPHAMAIAQFDPNANSSAAKTLAEEALSDAHRYYTSELVQSTRTRDSTGTISARYTLRHPFAGELTITVARSIATSRIYTSRTPRVKITIHHPSATPSAISEDILALASIDFGRKACIIDLPSILALEAEYMLDTAIAALFATAAIESEHVPESTITFAAPPRVPVSEPKKKRSLLRKNKKAPKSSSNGIWPLRKTGVREIDEPIEDMPSAAKSALALLELGIHGAFWALEKGVRKLDEHSAVRQ